MALPRWVNDLFNTYSTLQYWLDFRNPEMTRTDAIQQELKEIYIPPNVDPHVAVIHNLILMRANWLADEREGEGCYHSVRDYISSEYNMNFQLSMLICRLLPKLTERFDLTYPLLLAIETGKRYYIDPHFVDILRKFYSPGYLSFPILVRELIVNARHAFLTQINAQGDLENFIQEPLIQAILIPD